MNQESLQVVKTEKRKLFNTVYGRNRLKPPSKLLTPSSYVFTVNYQGSLKSIIVLCSTALFVQPHKLEALEESMDEHGRTAGSCPREFPSGTENRYTRKPG